MTAASYGTVVADDGAVGREEPAIRQVAIGKPEIFQTSCENLGKRNPLWPVPYPLG